MLALVASLQVPQPALWLHNPSPAPQVRIVAAALPLPRHWGAHSLAGLTVGSQPASWAPRLRWPDGSLALVHVQWRAELAANSSQRCVVHVELARDDATSSPAAAPGTDSWPDALPLHTEAVDPWGRLHAARLHVVDDRQEGASRWRRFAGSHAADEGTILLDVQVFLLHRAGEAFGEMTVVLDNGRCDPGHGYGPVRFERFSLVTDDPRLRLRPRWVEQNLLPPPVPAGDERAGCYRQDLLGPARFLYLGDGTAKAFRFDVAWDVAEADQARVIEATDRPLSAFPDLDWVRYTGAFGLHGGPAPVASARDDLAGPTVGEWRQQAEFGPFGGFGDPKSAVAPGSLRNGPSALHNVLRFRSADLLRVAEARVLQGLLRPLPGHSVRLPAAASALRQGLSQRAVRQPHGFESLEYEGISVDLLFDYWWFTADPLACDELARHGRAIRSLLERLPFVTSRGEGFCASALVAIALSTGDDALLTWTAARMRDRILPRLADTRIGALVQPPHPEALGGAAPFDAPWQMAALVHGLHALYRATDDEVFAAAAVEVARRMATHGWLEGTGPKYLVHAVDPQAFCLPRDYGPMQGTARFEIGAFVLAAELCGDDALLHHLFASRADAIVAAARERLGVLAPAMRADPWLQLWLDRRERSF